MPANRTVPSTLRLWRLVVIVGGVSGVMSDAIDAAEWYAVPSARIRPVYHENFTLSSVDPESVWGTSLDLKAELGVRTEVTGLAVKPRLRFSRYPDDGKFDSNDQFVELTTFRLTERGELRLDGAYTRDTTLRSETEDSGDELESTGLIQRRIRRERIRVAPSWTRSLSDRTELRLGLEHTDVSYEDAGQAGLSDYTYTLADGTVIYRLSDRAEVSGTVFISGFEAPDSSSETDEVGFLLGYGWAVTEWLRATAAAGLRYSDLEFSDAGVVRTDSDVGFLFDIGITAARELTEFEASLNRSVSPTGGGISVERLTLTVSAKRKITPRLNAALNVKAISEDTVGDAARGRERDLLRMRFHLAYRLTAELTLVPAYTYTYQDRKDRGDADDHALWLALEYKGSKRSLSR